MIAESGARSGGPHTVVVFALASAALLAFLFAANVYRAATQSVTIDEAFTYNHFVSVPYRQFDAHVPYNNHPLNTLLAKGSVALFGLSDVSLRLASVLCGLLYFVALFRLCRLLFGDSVWLLLAVALSSLNPYLLDQFSAARGYGIGVAFWTLGAWYAARWVTDPNPAASWRRRMTLVKVGVAFGLAAGAQMNELFAVAAMGASLLLVGLFRSLPDGRRTAWRPVALDALVVGGATVAVGLPLVWSLLDGRDMIDGVRKYWGAVQDFFNAGLFYRPTVLALWPRLWVGLHVWPFPLLLVFFGLLAASVGLIVYRGLRSGRRTSLCVADLQMVLFALTTLLTFFLLRIEPRLMHHTYFTGRRLLFTVPVLFITVPLGVRWMSLHSPWPRTLAFVGIVPLALLALQFGLQFNTEWYSDWKFDAGTKRIVNALRTRRPAVANEPLTIGADWRLIETLNYYRTRYGLSWIGPVGGYEPQKYYNLYVVDEKDLPSLTAFDVKPLYRDPVSKMVLAEPDPLPLVMLRGLGFSGQPVHPVDLHVDGAGVQMGRPGARRHLLNDFMCDADKDRWCWTFERPSLLFRVPRQTGQRLRIHLIINEKTFEQTGPVRLSVRVNGQPIGEKRFDVPGDCTFELPVAVSVLREGGLALVETTMDRYFVSPTDGQKLGYLLVAAGFVDNKTLGPE